MPQITITISDQTLLDDFVAAACELGNYRPTILDPDYKMVVPDPKWPATIPDPAWTATILDPSWQPTIPDPANPGQTIPNPTPQPAIANPTPRGQVPNPKLPPKIRNPVPQGQVPNPVTAQEFAGQFLLNYCKKLLLDHRGEKAATLARQTQRTADAARIAAATAGVSAEG